MSQVRNDDGRDPVDCALREAELLISQMRCPSDRGIGTMAPLDCNSEDEMITEKELLQMDSIRDGSSLSLSPDHINLDDMLRRAGQLVTTMTGKTAESTETENGEYAMLNAEAYLAQSTASSIRQDPEDILGQAELLANTIRSLHSSMCDADDNDDELSVDEMLLKAGLLAQTMQYSSSSVGEHHRVKSNEMDTPALLRASDALLSNCNWRDGTPHEHPDSTPDLLRRTDILLSQMMQYGDDDCSAKSTDSPVDDVLIQTQFLLDQYHVVSSHAAVDETISRNFSARPPRVPRPSGSPSKQMSQRKTAPVTPSPRQSSPVDTSDDVRALMARATKIEKMSQLIQATSSALAGVDTKSDLGIALQGNLTLMENAISSLQNAPISMRPKPPETHTPTSVSIQAAIDDELSSVGSGSARSLPLLRTSNSFNLTSPVNVKQNYKILIGNPESVDDAEELSKQMAAALEETFSQSSGQREQHDKIPTNLPKVPRTMDSESMEKLEKQRRWEKTSSKSVQHDDAILADFDKVSDIHGTVRFEKVSNARAGDNDYVPLVDYSKLSKKKSTPKLRSMEQPPSVWSNRKKPVQQKRGRRKRTIRLIAAVVILIVARAVWTWIQNMNGSENNELHSDKAAIVIPVEDDASDQIEPQSLLENEDGHIITESEEQEAENVREMDELDDGISYDEANELDIWDIDLEIEAFAAEVSVSGGPISPEEYTGENAESATSENAFQLEADDFDYEHESDMDSLEDGEGGLHSNELKKESEYASFDEVGLVSDMVDSKTDVSFTSNTTALDESWTTKETTGKRAVESATLLSDRPDRVDIKIIRESVPLPCLVPFSYIVSKGCRTVAKAKPLVDINGILHGMLQ